MPHNTYHLECPDALLLCFLHLFSFSWPFSSARRLSTRSLYSLLQEVDVSLAAGMVWCLQRVWTCTACSCTCSLIDGRQHYLYSAAGSGQHQCQWSGWVTGGFLGWVYLEPCVHFVGPSGRCSVGGLKMCRLSNIASFFSGLQYDLCCSLYNTRVSSQLLWYIILQSRWLCRCTFREFSWTMWETQPPVDARPNLDTEANNGHKHKVQILQQFWGTLVHQICFILCIRFWYII